MKSRPYVQRRRAEQASETLARILAAAIALFVEGGAEPTLEAVASRAGVTVQTVLRRFGSKDGLHLAAVEDARRRIADARDAAPVGDIPGAVANLIDHYEEWGDVVVRLLAMEEMRPAAAKATAEGRVFHHAWVERVFAPLLDRVPAAERRLRTASLVAVTDVYVWKVLRRDLGLPRPDVETAVADLVRRTLS
jgi:AcrR family transcriptional regulator